MSDNIPCWDMANNGKEHDWSLSDCPYCRIDRLQSENEELAKCFKLATDKLYENAHTETQLESDNNNLVAEREKLIHNKAKLQSENAILKAQRGDLRCVIYFLSDLWTAVHDWHSTTLQHINKLPKDIQDQLALKYPMLQTLDSQLKVKELGTKYNIRMSPNVTRGIKQALESIKERSDE